MPIRKAISSGITTFSAASRPRNLKRERSADAAATATRPPGAKVPDSMGPVIQIEFSVMTLVEGTGGPVP
jgi:hypothetical protein